MAQERIILGLMSGSSLDGLDMLLVKFAAAHAPQPGKLRYQILDQATLPYTEEWCQQLRQSSKLSLAELYSSDAAFGAYLASLCQTFLQGRSETIDLIALHGHTVYHVPEQGFTLQLGDAAAMAKQLILPVASDFRAQDIALGGQGAPLAPIVEQWLLSEHQLFLNLGGIANISYHQPDHITGFDIGAANQLLNALVQTISLPFDNHGALASTGESIPELLALAQQNAFFQKTPPKSLSNQWVQKEINPIFLNYSAKLKDKLATACTFLAWQLKLALEQIGSPKGSILVSGGGAYHDYLIEKMKEIIPNNIIIPEPWLIEQKEALLMALLGYLRLENIPNVISSVTGSQKDHCGGNIYHPF